MPYEVLSLGFYLYKWCVCLKQMSIGAQLKGNSPHWLPAESPLADRDTHVLICFCFQVTLHPPSHLQQFSPPPPCISSTFSAVLIYWPLRFNASFLGEVSVLVSDLRSPVLLIPGDFNLHMDVTSDTQHRIHCVTWFSPAVSAAFHLLWRVMISLTLWVSLPGFEVTHLFLDIEVHPLYPWCFFLLSCLFWEFGFFYPMCYFSPETSWSGSGLLPWFPESRLKSWLWFCMYHTAGFHKRKSTKLQISCYKCLDKRNL